MSGSIGSSELQLAFHLGSRVVFGQGSVFSSALVGLGPRPLHLQCCRVLGSCVPVPLGPGSILSSEGTGSSYGKWRWQTVDRAAGVAAF